MFHYGVFYNIDRCPADGINSFSNHFWKSKMKVYEIGSLTHYQWPTWAGDGFEEDEPQELWQRLPKSLRNIALEEVRVGNTIYGISENHARDIIEVSFAEGPLVSRKSDKSIRIHTEPGPDYSAPPWVKATYKDISGGCSLRFADPEFEESDCD